MRYAAGLMAALAAGVQAPAAYVRRPDWLTIGYSHVVPRYSSRVSMTRVVASYPINQNEKPERYVLPRPVITGCGSVQETHGRAAG